MARPSKTQPIERRPQRAEATAPAPPGDSVPESRLPARSRRLVILGIVALGAALRFWHLRHGLPDFTEEAIPFRRALEMWGLDGNRIDWNPHFFHYPSLTLYLHLLLQKLHYGVGRLLGVYSNPADYLVSFQTDPSPMVPLARLVGVVADLVTIVCAARIGERLRRGAGIVGALLTACAPTLIASSRTIFVDTVMVAFAMAALEWMLAYRAGGGAKSLAATVVLIGLAMGSKYPAVVLLVPLGWVLWERHRAHGVWMWLGAAAAACGVFLITTPYAVIDFAAFRRDFEFVGRLGAQGHLGNLATAGFTYHARNLARDLGWVGLAFLPVSLALTALRSARRGDAVALWLALLAFGLPISFAHIFAERYLNPVIPLGAVLAASAAIELVGRVAGRGRRAAGVAVMAAIGLPSLASGIETASRVPDAMETEARRWCEAHLTSHDLLVREQYGAPILSRLDWHAFQTGARFHSASEAVQRRYLKQRRFSVVTLPLDVLGPPDCAVTSLAGARVRLRVFPHVVDFNRVYYDPRLFAGVDYVLTSSAVRGRFEADRNRYAVENRLYALLDSSAGVAARFRDRTADGERQIVIYRVGPRARAAIDGFGPLDPLWWAAFIPRPYREQAETLLVPVPQRTAGHLRDAAGTAAGWVRTLTPIFENRLRPLAVAMAFELMEHRRPDLARRFAMAVLEMDPGNEWACLTYSEGSRALGEWDDARTAIERSLGWMAQEGRSAPSLNLEHADVLVHEGGLGQARLELRQLIGNPDTSVANEARRRLSDPRGPFARRP